MSKIKITLLSFFYILVLVAEAEEWNLYEHLKDCLVYTNGIKNIQPIHFFYYDEGKFKSPYCQFAVFRKSSNKDKVGGGQRERQLFVHPLGETPTIIEFNVVNPGKIKIRTALSDAAALASAYNKSIKGIRIRIKIADHEEGVQTIYDEVINTATWHKKIIDLSGRKSANVILIFDPNGNSSYDHVCLTVSGEGTISSRKDALAYSVSRLPDKEFKSQELQLYFHCPFLLAGVIEELRSNGIRIPARLQEIEDEVFMRLNFPPFFSSGAYRERIREAAKILRTISFPPELPKAYGISKFFRLKPKRQALPPWKLNERLKDRVLATEGKAYPYLIDYNGDGIKDLILGNHSGSISICHNVGTNREPLYKTMSFLNGTDTGKPLCFAPNSKLAFADMNGNGRKDIVLGSYGGNVRMLPNRSNDGFVFCQKDEIFFTIQNKQILNAGFYAYPCIVDWNLDGLNDLLVGEEGGRVMIYLNCGTRSKPNFNDGKTILSIAPDMYPDPDFKDMNNDGLPDIIIGGREGKIYFFPNCGSKGLPRFTDFQYLTFEGKPIDVGRLSEIFAGDWNGDGKIDLLVGNDDGEVRIFTCSGVKGNAPIFGKEIWLKTSNKVNLVPKVYSITCPVDWNGDGKTDLLMGGEGEEIRFYPNVGTVSKPEFDSYSLLPIVVNKKIAGSKKETSFWNNKALEFVTEYCGNISPEVTDWNGDGKLDILVGNYTGMIYLYLNQGTSENPCFSKPVALKAGDGVLRVAGFSSPRVADYNSDGLPDLLTGDLLGRIHVFLNIGERRKPRLAKGKILRVGNDMIRIGPRSVVECGDLNGDGRKDLLVSSKPGNIFFLINTGSNVKPAFETMEKLRIVKNGLEKPLRAFALGCIRLIDWNGDGQNEIMISDNSHGIWIYRLGE